MRWWPFSKPKPHVVRRTRLQELAYMNATRMRELKRDEIYLAGGTEADILACKDITPEDWARYEVQMREWWLKARVTWQ